MLVYEIQSLLIDLAHDFGMAFIRKNGGMSIPYEYSDEDIIFKGKPFCSIEGRPFTDMFFSDKPCHSQFISINTDRTDLEDFYFLFESSASGIWFGKDTEGLHGVRLVLILESFMKGLETPSDIFEKYSMEFRNTVRRYGYSLAESVMKKAHRNIIDASLRKKWEQECDYHRRNDEDNHFRDSESAYKLFCVLRRQYERI